MITKEEFLKFVEEYETFEKGVERFEKALGGRPYAINLWEADWIEAVGFMWDYFMESHFTEEGFDLINWWKFEDVDHIITCNIDSGLFGISEVKYNVNDINDLWDYLNKFSSDYIKDLKNCKSNV